jgi:replicative DNA helicase
MAAELSQNGDIFEGIEQVETQLSGIYGDLTNEETLDEQTKRTYELILQNTIKYQNKEITGISTGIDELDRYTNGWQKKSLNIIAGRPGMGKSVAGLSTALAALKLGKSVVFFSLEMSSEEVLMRLTSMLSGVPLYKIKNGEINKDETILVAKTLEKINQYNFTLIDSSLELSKLRRYVKRYSRQGKADIVVIDYLQLITTPNQKLRRDEVAIVSKTLKQIAKESDIPIIALAQINRDNEKRAKEDKRPQLSDLAESASIEQDADIVIMLYRAEYYNPEAIDEHGYSVKGRGEYIIRKQRSGAIGTCHVEFNSRTMLYKNL